METTYAEQIRDAYEGEIWGEAFFATLAAHRGEPGARRKFAALARLESETKTRMLPLMRRLGLDSAEIPALQAKGAALAAEWQGLSWTDLMDRLQAEVQDYVARYADLARGGPPEDADILRHIADHERAIFTFTRRELGGDDEHSLADVLALLAGRPTSGS